MAKARPLFLVLQRFVVLTLAFTLGIGELPAYAAEAAAAPQQDAQAAAPVDTSPEALDHLLAPIALYPDAILMQVLAASLDTQEVLDAGNWLLENKSLEGTALDDAAKKAGFGAAMTALLHFPDVVDMMCTQLDWTGQVGAAFNANQAAVLDSVQRLRAQALQYGNLKTTPQQQVVTQQDNGKQVIVIQPANPQVVYVPQYNPQTVYVQSSGPSTGDVVAASVISFGLGVAVGALFANNNYYYPRWGYGGVYYGGRPWYPTHYVYRPIYGPHWRPAVGYRPPPNYPYHRPNYNNNYFNRYRGGNNNYNGNRPGNGNNGGYNRPGNGNNNNRPGNGNNGGYNKPGNNNNNRPGNGNNGGYNKPGNSVGTTRPTPGNGRPVNGGYNKPGNGSTGNGSNRPNPPNNVARPAPDRGYTRPAGGGSPPPQSRPGGAGTRPAAPQQRPGNAATRPAPAPARPASPPRQPSAFSPGGGGRQAQAASQRGAASNAQRGGGGNARRTK